MDTEAFQTILPTHYDSAEYRALRASLVLWALTDCLRELGTEGLLQHRGQPIVAFCGLTDCNDMFWAPRETARIINPRKVFTMLDREFKKGKIGKAPKPTQMKDYFLRFAVS
ncbi:MAG: hypothetical protein ACRC8S_12355 [Fimbriiglobus sp.]